MHTLSLVVVMLVSSLNIQADSTAGARIRGKARSSFDGRPLAGVMVSVPEAGKSVVTDSTGVFWLSGIPSGRQRVRIGYEGRETRDYIFLFQNAHTKRIAVVIDVEALDLDPIVVEARQTSSWRDLAGFFERRVAYTGFARFFTRAEIDRIDPERISSLLVLEGIATRCFQWCMPTRFSRGALCAVPINVDGMPFREDNYDRIRVSDVAGVEVYRGVPPYGLSASLAVTPGSSVWMGGGFPTTGSCGLVLIWTR